MTIINFSKLFWNKNISIDELEAEKKACSKRLQVVLDNVEENKKKLAEANQRLTDINAEMELMSSTNGLFGSKEQIIKILRRYYDNYTEKDLEQIDETKKLILIEFLLRANLYTRERKESFAQMDVQEETIQHLLKIQSPSYELSEEEKRMVFLMPYSLYELGEKLAVKALLTRDIIKSNSPVVELTDEEFAAFKHFYFFSIVDSRTVIGLLKKLGLKDDKIDKLSPDEAYENIKSPLLSDDYFIIRYFTFEQYNEAFPEDFLTSEEYLLEEKEAFRNFMKKVFHQEQICNRIYKILAQNFPDEYNDSMDIDKKIELMRRWQREHAGENHTLLKDIEEILSGENVAKVDSKYFKILKSSSLPPSLQLNQKDIAYLLSDKNSLKNEILLSEINRRALPKILAKGLSHIFSESKEALPPASIKYDHPLTEEEIKSLSYSEKLALAKEIYSRTCRFQKFTRTENYRLYSFCNNDEYSRNEVTRQLKSSLNLEFSPLNESLESLTYEEQEALLRQMLRNRDSRQELLSELDKTLLNNYTKKEDIEKINDRLPIDEIKEKLSSLHKQTAEMDARIKQLHQEIAALAPKETFARGHLIKSLQQLIVKKRSLGIDTTEDEKLLQEQVKFHKEQITKRLSESKQSPNHKISFEVGLKCEMLIAAYSKLKASTKDNRQEIIREGIEDTISTIGSIAKIPAISLTKAIHKGASVTITAVGLPSYLVNRLSRIANHETPYDNQKIEEMGGSIATAIRRAMEKIEVEMERREDGIKRM